MIGEVQYGLEDIDGDGTQYLVKREIIAMNAVTISQDPSGEMVILPKAQPAPVATDLVDKYRLEPEGDMFRLYALRQVRSDVRPGDRGGLVSSPDKLAHHDTCWVYPGGRVEGESRVLEHATVLGIVTGYCDIRGSVHIGAGSKVTGGSANRLNMDGDTSVLDSTVTTSGIAALTLNGLTRIANSKMEVSGEDVIWIGGGNVREGHVRRSRELLAVSTNWGWLTGYRNDCGELSFTVGCQYVDADQLLVAARNHEVSDLEMAMLRGFVDIVKAAQASW